MRLPEVQAGFSDLAWGDDAALEALAGRFSGPPALVRRRLAIYRDGVRLKAVEKLRLGFPKTADLASPEGFSALVLALARSVPPQSRTTRGLARALPGFLAGRAPEGRPDLAALAALELARDDVADAAVPTPAAMAALAGVEPEELSDARLRLTPALRLLSLDFDVTGVWQCLEDGLTAPPPATGASCVMVWRDAGGHVAHATLDAAEAAGLARALAGRRLGEVCEALAGAAADPADACAAALQAWFEDGLVVDVSRRARNPQR